MIDLFLQDDLNQFFNVLSETKDSRNYAKYGVYLENTAKNLGWHDLLHSNIYVPLENLDAKIKILEVMFSLILLFLINFNLYTVSIIDTA